MSTREEAKIKAIQEPIIAGLQKMLHTEFEILCQLTTESEFSDAFNKIPSQNRGNTFAFLKLVSVEYNTQDSIGTLSSIRPHALNSGASLYSALGARQRRLLDTDSTILQNSATNGKLATHTLVASLVPAIFTFDFCFFTKDFHELLGFMSKWAFTQVKTRLNFELTYGNLKLPIMVNLGTSLTAPEKSKLGENAGYYQFEGQISVSGALSNNNIRDTYVVPVIHADQVEVKIYE